MSTDPLRVIDEVMAANPYTNYQFVAQNAEVEAGRANRHALTIARAVVAALATKQVAPSLPETVRTKLRQAADEIQIALDVLASEEPGWRQPQKHATDAPGWLAHRLAEGLESGVGAVQARAWRWKGNIEGNDYWRYCNPPDGVEDRIEWREPAAQQESEAVQPPAPEPVAWANSDEIDNMLDDRTATVAGKPDGWRKTPLYRAALAAAQPDNYVLRLCPQHDHLNSWSWKFNAIAVPARVRCPICEPQP